MRSTIIIARQVAGDNGGRAGGKDKKTKAKKKEKGGKETALEGNLASYSDRLCGGETNKPSKNWASMTKKSLEKGGAEKIDLGGHPEFSR